jgi:hypothetical protein
MDTIQYLFSSNFAKLESNREPDVLLKYYDQYYPDAESDAKSEESDPGWLPV